MWNVFKYEFKMYRSSILIWSIVILAMLTMFVMMFPAFGSDQEIMDKILENYPKEMLQVMGMSSELPLSSVLGYFAFVFAFIQLLLAIQASNYGFSMLSVEEREFTADYLMSKPVSRIGILNAKFLSAFLSILIVSVVTFLGSLLIVGIFDDGKPYDQDKLMILLSSSIIFQMFFMTIGMAVSVIVRRIRNVLTFSLGLSFGMYTINGIKAVIGSDTLKYLTPFHYFEAGGILKSGEYDITYLGIALGVILVSIVTTYILYVKRDIYSL